MLICSVGLPLSSSPTAGPSTDGLLSRRGGSDPYTSATYFDAPPKTTYAPHTSELPSGTLAERYTLRSRHLILSLRRPCPQYAAINGSRSSFIAVIVIAFLILCALVAGGWWLLILRRRRRIRGGGGTRTTSGRRNDRSGSSAGPPRSSLSFFDRRPWGRLRDSEQEADEQDAFALSPNTNLSVMDLNTNSSSPELPKYTRYGGSELAPGQSSPELQLDPDSKRYYNPVYAASGETVNWQGGGGSSNDTTSQASEADSWSRGGAGPAKEAKDGGSDKV